MSSDPQGNNDCSLFSSRTPQFFKIIMSTDAVERQKLMIPETFIEKYGNILQNSVILQVLDGRRWKVRVARRDGILWLKGGWREFMDYYSIGCYYYLAFRLVGIARFRVTIFDPTATEIEYPFKSASKSEYSDIQVLGTSRKRDKSPVVCPRPGKVWRTASTGKTRISPKNAECSEKNRKEKFNSTSQKDGKGTGTGLRIQESKKNGTVMQRERKANCLRMANQFASQSKKSFFTITVRRTSVPPYCQGRLRIPIWFARKHFLHTKGLAYLHCSNTTRAVNYRCETKKAMLFGDGCSAFMIDNKLKFDDACVFELDNTGQHISFEVSIFRADEVENHREQSGKF
ncbi:hypothetical protein ACFE04_022936 [Oxalis oulophora]